MTRRSSLTQIPAVLTPGTSNSTNSGDPAAVRRRAPALPPPPARPIVLSRSIQILRPKNELARVKREDTGLRPPVLLKSPYSFQ
jgi:hypothetical protein